MPPELQPYLPFIITAVVSLFVGWLITYLAAGSAKSALIERMKSEERRTADAEARLAIADAENQRNETAAQNFRNQLAETNSRLKPREKPPPKSRRFSTVPKPNSLIPSKHCPPMP